MPTEDREPALQSALALNRNRSTVHEPAQGFRLRIGGGSRAAGRARNEIGRLREELDGHVLESVRLLVTELVTNAVRHAGAGAVELVVVVGRERVRVEVANPGVPFEPDIREAGRESESGWGLFLVDRLSDAWGVVDDSGYQRIWFELARA